MWPWCDYQRNRYVEQSYRLGNQNDYGHRRSCGDYFGISYLRSSSRIIKILGETGNNVMMRLMGLIVMVIAVEFFFSGLKPIVIDILRSVG